VDIFFSFFVVGSLNQFCAIVEILFSFPYHRNCLWKCNSFVMSRRWHGQGSDPLQPRTELSILGEQNYQPGTSFAVGGLTPPKENQLPTPTGAVSPAPENFDRFYRGVEKISDPSPSDFMRFQK
jgi:hypothetical protein